MGQKRTSENAWMMSALPPKADIGQRELNATSRHSDARFSGLSCGMQGWIFAPMTKTAFTIARRTLLSSSFAAVAASTLLTL
jgi:hypothetical protein